MDSDIKGNECKICGQLSNYAFNAEILSKYTINYYQCPNCEFVQTESPFWLQEAYDSPMNFTDTGIMVRNQRFSRITASLIVLFFDTKAKFLDFAGGYGIFSRIMRDMGFDFYWDDPYTKNLLSRGFERSEQHSYQAVTTFESFEHFLDPITEIENILSISDTIIFSTEPISFPLPTKDDWWYYAFEHGQHIAFYSPKTFQHIAQKLQLHYFNIGNMHLLTKKKLGYGTFLFQLPYVKHLLYALSFVLTLGLKSRTASDMNNLK